MIDACLAARVPYVDIANEWPAVRGLLDRDEQARAHAVALVTGAGFGPAATETLVLRLVEQLGVAPDLVRVAAAAGVTRQSDGVRQTVQESLSQGVALTYRDGQVVREALGGGATILTFGGAQRQMLPGPVGDLETARLASGAANVVAYIASPAARGSGTDSCTWAEATGPGGRPSPPSCTPVKVSAQRPPSPPKQPSASWPESSPAHGPLASCSAPILSPMPPVRQ